MGRCSDLGVNGVQALVESREGAVWELAVYRARLAGTAVERKCFVENPFLPPTLGCKLNVVWR